MAYFRMVCSIELILFIWHSEPNEGKSKSRILDIGIDKPVKKSGLACIYASVESHTCEGSRPEAFDIGRESPLDTAAPVS